MFKKYRTKRYIEREIFFTPGKTLYELANKVFDDIDLLKDCLFSLIKEKKNLSLEKQVLS